MPDPTDLTPSRVAELRAIAEKATEASERAGGHAPLPWVHARPWPATWLISQPGEKGDAVHVADVRGWGYLTGSGMGALGLDHNTAFEVQKAWGDVLALGTEALVALPALLDEIDRLKAERDEAQVAWNYERSRREDAEAQRDAAQAEAKALRGALDRSDAAMREYYRYWTGGETRGSYDGKPEREALWKAMWANRAALAAGSEAKVEGERCHADRDGECRWDMCPQVFDAEPERSGRHCPLDVERDADA